MPPLYQLLSCSWYYRGLGEEFIFLQVAMVCFYNNVCIYAVLTLSSSSSVTSFYKQSFKKRKEKSCCYISPCTRREWVFRKIWLSRPSQAARSGRSRAHAAFHKSAKNGRKTSQIRGPKPPCIMIKCKRAERRKADANLRVHDSLSNISKAKVK